MENECVIERILLHLEEEREKLAGFLSRHHLGYERDIEVAYGIFDDEYRLLGCGCAAGSLLKCFAIEGGLRGQNALGALVSLLVQQRFLAGYYDLFVITRIDNEQLFLGCGFFTVVKTDELVMLENCPDGPGDYAALHYRRQDDGKHTGAIVMNCNPFTLGHRALVEYAASRCDALYLFVVEEDRSSFPTQVRCRLVQEGVSDLDNVRVCLSGHYMISKATFPTYFLKENENVAALQAELDITLFGRRIAPLFHITTRFAGQEPADPVTALYNDAMRTILPRCGIAFEEMPRIERSGAVVSASRVRALIADPKTYEQAYSLVPESTRRYLEERRAEHEDTR